MIFEDFSSVCPVDFEGGQNLTDAQQVVHEAAIKVHEYPIVVAEAADECERRLATRYLNNRNPTGTGYYIARYELLGNVRRLIPQALGFRAVYSAMPGIKEIFESGFNSSSMQLLPAEYEAPYGHVHTGEEARLMRLVAGRLGRMTLRTLGTFRSYERDLLQENFEYQTKIAALGTRDVIYRKYGLVYDRLPQAIREAPRESDLIDPLLVKLLGRLRRPDVLQASFHNAVVSGAESGVIMLKHFRQALFQANCPRALWAPLAYANAAKLSLPAAMTFWDAKQLHEKDVSDQNTSIFKAYRHDNTWRIDFASPNYQKIYSRKRPVGCQGAFILPPQDEDDLAKLTDWHTFMTEKSQKCITDTDYRKGTNAAQMAIINAIALAERENYL